MIISTLIVSYNTKDVLKCCVKSLEDSLKSDFPNDSYEVIVVDNASSDGSVEMLHEEFPKVKVIANKHNAWFAEANNQAAQIAQGRYLFLLNSDTIVQAGNIKKLVDFMESASSKVALCGPVTLNQDGTLQSFGYALSGFRERLIMCARLHRTFFKKVVKLFAPIGIPYPGDENLCRKVGWIAGCNMLFRKDVYAAIGGLNPAVGFYGEEPEVGWRLAKSNYESWIVADAFIIHLGGVSAQTLQSQDRSGMLKFRMTNYTKLMKMTNGVKKGIRMSMLVIAIAYVKLLLYHLKPDATAVANVKAAIKYEKELIKFMKSYRSSLQ